MNVSARFPSMPPSRSPRAVLILGAVLALAALAAYRNSFSIPFFFDDGESIAENPTIRHLWPPGEALSPPHGGTGVANRPIVNLSLAINFAIGQLEVRTYHYANVFFHACAGLLLFGIVRRTLLLPTLSGRFATAALPAGFFSAAIWLLHPLLTESVVCVIQRTELIFSVFYLGTLYAFIRQVQHPAARGWGAMAVGACLLGMASKEVMVSAPLVVLLYDRTFVAGSFRAAWRSRSALYLGLAATWLLLGYLVLRGGGTRGNAAGFGVGVTAWSYALKQCEALTTYFKLSFWPHPLVVDYGTGVIDHLAAVWPKAIAVVAFVVATGLALVRRPMLGFLGTWVLVLLAPSSSFLPLVSQTMAEHRMYLPLAALAVAAVLGLQAILRVWAWPIAVVLALGLGALTVRRNQDYETNLGIWNDTVAKVPGNARARVNLGSAYKLLRRYDEAMAQFRAALPLQPSPEALNNIGAILLEIGRPAEAIEPCRAALRLESKFAMAHNNLGSALARTGSVVEAREHIEKALELKPTLAPAHSNLAALLLAEGRLDQAIEHAREALRLKPDLWDAHENLGNALLRAGHPAEAVGPLERAALHLPPSAILASNLGGALYQLGRPAEAIPRFEAALRLDPDFIDALNNLASALFQVGRAQESVAGYRRALLLKPDRADLHCNLGIVLSQTGQVPEAIAAYEQALRLQPDLAIARNNLAYLRAARPPGAPRD